MPGPYAVHRPVENVFLVRQRGERRLRELAGVAAAVLVLGGGLFAYTWVHVEMLRTGYRVDELEKELSELLEAERKWRLEAAWAAHPERLEARAHAELGMVAPRLEQMVFYDEIAEAEGAPDPLAAGPLVAGSGEPRLPGEGGAP